MLESIRCLLPRTGELSFQVIKEDPANSRPEVTNSREFTNVTAAVLPVRSIQFTAPFQLRSAYRNIPVWSCSLLPNSSLRISEAHR